MTGAVTTYQLRLRRPDADGDPAARQRGAGDGDLHLRRDVAGPTDDPRQRDHDDQHLDGAQPARDADDDDGVRRAGGVARLHLRHPRQRRQPHGHHAAAPCCTTTPCPAPTTAGTWTTAYGYDAYDRLLSSATYAGPLQNPAPTPTTATSYTLDVDGDVVGTTTTTRRTIGGRPLVTTSRVTNTIDDAGQLTARTTGSAAPVPQVFDADGRLTQSLTGAALTYDALDRVSTATVGGATTTLRLLAGRQPPAGPPPRGRAAPHRRR